MTELPFEASDPVRTPPDAAARSHALWPERLLVMLSLAGLLLVPLAFSPGLTDRFRIIKESLSRAESLIGAVLIVVAVTFGSSDRIRSMLRQRLLAYLVFAGIGWTALTTLTSTNRALSVASFVTLFTSALLFFVVWYAAPRISLRALDLLVPVVLVNTALAALQEYGIWNPFTVPPDTPQHFTANALIGNPNLVGAYLSLTALILLVAAMTVGGARRYFYGFGAAMAVVGVFISQSRSAVLTLAAGALLLGLANRRRALATLSIILVVTAAALALDLRAVTSLTKAIDLIRARQLNALTSQRFVASLTAVEMFRDRPLTGMGPGTFPYHYFPYRARLPERYPADVIQGTAVPFEVTHNEHLQFLAETGLPGYVLFLSLVAWIAGTAWRSRPGDDPRRAFSRAVAIPLAAAFLVLCIAQFPLHVAVTKHLIVSFAALLVGWSRT